MHMLAPGMLLVGCLSCGVSGKFWGCPKHHVLVVVVHDAVALSELRLDRAIAALLLGGMMQLASICSP